MGKRPKSELTHIGDIIQNLLSDGTLPFKPDDVEIWRVWREVVGPTYAENTRPSKIKNKKLTVMVTDPIWLQEMSFFKETIIEKLNRKLGRKVVTGIDIKVGPR